MPVAFETSGAWGSAGDKHSRMLVRLFLRPMEEIGPDENGRMSFVDHGGSYSIFVRHLREVVAVTLQRANAECVRHWVDHCVPKVPKPAAAAGGAAEVAGLPPVAADGDEEGAAALAA